MNTSGARCARDSGAVAVETSLLLSLVLLPVLLGTVDAARGFALSSRLAAAAREGAALAQTAPGRVSCGVDDSITARAVAESFTGAVPAPTVAVSVAGIPRSGCSDTPGVAPGTSVTVRVSRSFTPLFGYLGPAAFTLTRTTTVQVQGA